MKEINVVFMIYVILALASLVYSPLMELLNYAVTASCCCSCIEIDPKRKLH